MSLPPSGSVQRLEHALRRNNEQSNIPFDFFKLLLCLGVIVLLDQSVPLAQAWQSFYTTWVVPVSASPYGEPAFSVGGVALGGIAWGILANGVFNLTPLKPKFTGGPALDSWWLLANITVFFGSVLVIQELLLKPFGLFHLIYSDSPDPYAPSFTRLVLEVAFSVFLYDFLLYWIHKSWHRAGSDGTQAQKDSADAPLAPSPLSALRRRLRRYWYEIHLAHHDHYQNTKYALWAGATLHHHLFDGGAHVVVSLLVNQAPLLFLGFTERHPASKILHLLVVQWMLVESHSGLDAPFMLHRVFPALCGGSVRHQVHHDTGGRYYQQFFKYLDDSRFLQMVW